MAITLRVRADKERGVVVEEEEEEEKAWLITRLLAWKFIRFRD